MYFNGKAVEQNYKKTVGRYCEAIDLGNPTSMYNLGWMYNEGLGIIRNLEKSNLYMINAINVGYLVAEDIIEENKGCFIFELALSKNYDKKLYEFAASVGNYYAMHNMGIDYYTEGKYVKAKKWLERTLKLLDDPYTWFYLGEIYYNGYGVNKDFSKAKECYERASKEVDEAAEALKKRFNN